MSNVVIRTALKENAVCQWMVAEELKIQESAFSRKLRHELPDDERERVLEAIARIVARREEGK